MRGFVAVAILSTASCGYVEGQRQMAADSASAATLAQIERVVSSTLQRTDRYAGSANRRLSPMPVMTAFAEAELRRFRNNAHVARARALGVRAVNEQVVDSLVDAGRFIQLEDSTRYWIVRRGASPATVVPEMRSLLEELGRRFHARLADLGLPGYRIEVTSALRTTERQAELRRTNSNAAAGVSSHEFGTTVDLSYAAFAPPEEIPDHILADVPPALAPHLDRVVDLALESVSGRKSRELGAVFSDVLAGAQRDGLALVIYERQQTVYHLTIGRDSSDLVQAAPQ